MNTSFKLAAQFENRIESLRFLRELVQQENGYELDRIHWKALDPVKEQGLNVGTLV
jgi:hypothetical protein